MARPKKIENAHKVVVYLGSQTHEMARVLGAGNVSEGIRRAVALTYASREAERFEKAAGSLDAVMQATGVRRASALPRKKADTRGA